MQVEVHHIDAHIAGAQDAQQGVHVGAIAIDQPAAIVDSLDDMLKVLIEEPQRVGVGQHQADDGIVALRLECRQVHVAALIGGDLDDLQTDHAGGSRVGAVRRIGDEHLDALRIAAGLVVGAHDEHAGQLAVGASCRLEGDCGKSADLLQPFLHFVHQPQRTLGGFDGL